MPIDPHKSAPGTDPGLPSTLDEPRRLFDAATGLPSLTSLFEDLEPVLGGDGATVLYVHLASNPIIEERFGWVALGAYVNLVNNFLERFARNTRADRDHCIVTRAFADDYVILMSQGATDEALAGRLVDGMSRHIQAYDEELAGLHQLYVGMSHITSFSRVHPERLIYRGIQSAQTEAMDVGRQRLSIQTRVLESCIADPQTFSMVYQPLVRISDHAIFAYEGLVRCSQEELRNPHVLFNVAERGGKIWPLSRLLRRKVVEPLDALPEPCLLFINLHPADFEDPELLAPEPFILEHASRLVLEVTERAAISDVSVFRRNIERLRSNGLRIAIDDLGSGYTALSVAADIKPEFIKFDMTLIRDIDQSPSRQNLVRNMVSFAVEAGAEVVAEGVETPEEYNVLRELGCHHLQGYYLAKPAPAFVETVTPPPGDLTFHALF